MDRGRAHTRLPRRSLAQSQHPPFSLEAHHGRTIIPRPEHPPQPLRGPALDDDSASLMHSMKVMRSTQRGQVRLLVAPSTGTEPHVVNMKLLHRGTAGNRAAPPVAPHDLLLPPEPAGAVVIPGLHERIQKLLHRLPVLKLPAMNAANLPHRSAPQPGDPPRRHEAHSGHPATIGRRRTELPVQLSGGAAPGDRAPPPPPLTFRAR